MPSNDQKAATGSITGFTEINLNPDGTVADAMPAPKFSAAEFLHRIMELRKDLSPEARHALETIIDNHRLNTNNPHDVTLADIEGGIIEDMIAPYFPGTVPVDTPVLHAVADLVEFLEGISVARSTETTKIDSSGKLVTVPINEISVDYCNDGMPMISLWPARTNLNIQSDAVSAIAGDVNSGRWLSESGSSTQAASDGSILGPDETDRCVVYSDSAVNAMFGSAFRRLDVTAGTIYTSSMFLLPLGAGYATLKLYDMTNIGATMDDGVEIANSQIEINLGTGEVISEGTAIREVYVQRQASGYLRIGVEYEAPVTGLMSLHAYGHIAAGTPTYVGTGIQLFSVFGLQHCAGVGLSPYIPTTGAPVVCTGTVLTVAAGSKLRSTEGMLNMEWLSTNTEGPLSFLSVGGLLTINVDGTTHITDYRGEATFTDTLVAGEMTGQAISFSPTKIATRSSGNARNDLVGAFSQLDASHDLVFGPIPGYLRSVTVYPMKEDAQTLDYLVGEID